MALIEMDFANGGGTDISDLIAQTNGFDVSNLRTYDALFVVGINTIKVTSTGNSQAGVVRDTNVDSGTLLGTIPAGGNVDIDVSNYNVVYIKGTSTTYSTQTFNIKILS